MKFPRLCLFLFLYFPLSALSQTANTLQACITKDGGDNNYALMDCDKNWIGVPVLEAKQFQQYNIGAVESYFWLTAGFTASEANQLRSADVGVQDATKLKEAGYSNVKEMIGWVSAYDSADNVIALKKSGFTDEQITEWSSLAAKITNIYSVDIPLIVEWKNAGYSPADAYRYHEQGLSPISVLAVKKYCKNGLSKTNIEDTNPYGVMGNCYLISITIMQLLNERDALGQVNGAAILLRFKKHHEPAAGDEISAVVMGTGTFKYTAIDGSIEIVPRAEEIYIDP